MSVSSERVLSTQLKRLMSKSLSKEVYEAYASKFEKRASHERWTKHLNEPLPETINPGELQNFDMDICQDFFRLKVITYVRIILVKANFVERVHYYEQKEHDSISDALVYLSSLSERYAKGGVL